MRLDVRMCTIHCCKITFELRGCYLLLVGRWRSEEERERQEARARARDIYVYIYTGRKREAIQLGNILFSYIHVVNSEIPEGTNLKVEAYVYREFLKLLESRES